MRPTVAVSLSVAAFFAIFLHLSSLACRRRKSVAVLAVRSWGGKKASPVPARLIMSAAVVTVGYLGFCGPWSAMPDARAAPSMDWGSMAVSPSPYGAVEASGNLLSPSALPLRLPALFSMLKGTNS